MQKLDFVPALVFSNGLDESVYLVSSKSSVFSFLFSLFVSFLSMVFINLGWFWEGSLIVSLSRSLPSLSRALSLSLSLALSLLHTDYILQNFVACYKTYATCAYGHVLVNMCSV